MYNLVINDYDRQVYEKELKGFLPPEFIDIHTHIWLNTMPKVGKANGGATWTRLVADEMSGEQLVDSFKRLFPENKVTPLVFGGCSEEVKICNDYVYDSAKKHQFPILTRTDYDMDADALAREVHANHSLGLKPYLTFCPPYIPASEIRIFDFLPYEHLEVANKNGWIVMLHIARDLRLRDAMNVAQLMEIEKRYPNVKLVVAHIGRAYSKQDIGDAFEILKNTKNMMFDFTANVCDDAIEACINAVGTERLMFGSDLPIAIMRMYRTTDETGWYKNIVPRGLYGDVSYDRHMQESDEENITLMIYEQIRAFKRVATKLHLTDTQIENIMFTNAKNLLAAAERDIYGR